jgi:hypothetical protein
MQWVNGSFVNLQTANPKDIDLVTFIDHELAEKYKTELEDFGARTANSVFGVDAYILITYPEGHTAYTIYSYDRVYWAELFSRTRRDKYGKKNPKGYLEIIY